MKATINGIEVEGTPEEIVEYHAIASGQRKEVVELATSIKIDGRKLAKALHEHTMDRMRRESHRKSAVSKLNKE